MKTFIVAIASFSAGLCAASDCDFSGFVDPFVGTSATGHTFPAACVPFGLVQAGPDTGNGTWDYCSGYRHEDKTICGFTQTHLNGTGCPDLGDVRILPLGNVEMCNCENMEFCKYENGKAIDTNRNCHNCSQITNKNSTRSTRLNISPLKKLSEIAEPGYCAVSLDGGIRVEIAAEEHSAMYRIVSRGKMRLLVDCAYGIGTDRHPMRITASDIKLDGKSGLSGRNHRLGWVERDYAFAVVFSRECVASVELPRSKGQVASQYVFDFDSAESPLLVKIALSAEGDAEAAKRNLEAEIPHWDFDLVRSEARAKWNEVLGRATIDGSEEQKKNWYTALYHLFMQPNNIADVGDKPFYSTFSCWDTFRAAHPLYTILAPEKAGEFVDSMLEQGRRTGYLPIWTLWGRDNQCMIGTHSVPVIVDWFLKECESVELCNCGNMELCKYENGDVIDTNRNCHNCSQITNTNSTRSTCSTRLKNDRLLYWLAAYAQIKDTLTKPHDGRRKERWDLLDKYGYYPFDEIKGESVSRTLECAYDDWCAGMMAQKLWELFANDNCHNCSQITNANVESLKADAEFFFKRSDNWRNVFDPSIGLVRGKDTKGDWRTPYDPYALGHGAAKANDFTEGNAFQYSWHVMQNPQGLVAAMGGRDEFVGKLDALFSAPSKTEGMGEVLDVTGLIGQYVHGNEPSHHVIYFYPQVGHPEKAAERIREVLDKFYLPKPDGLCGNDDCGQMSAWYLFSAMGFYPFNPCGGEYVIGAPQVEKVVLLVGNDTNGNCHNCSQITNANSSCSRRSTRLNTFTVIARNLSKENKYVKSVSLNGKPIADWKIRHSDIMRGGEIVFEMSAYP